VPVGLSMTKNYSDVISALKDSLNGNMIRTFLMITSSLYDVLLHYFFMLNQLVNSRNLQQ
jgi:hypothetical protein